MGKTAMDSISVRVPAAEKRLFLKNAQRNGTDAAAAIRAFVHAFNAEGGYPFDPAHYYPIDADEEAEIRELKAELQAGGGATFSRHATLRASLVD
ncbi:MAG: hypothetical protein LBD90_04530 [Bifidobacteriaceae bacterium]|jgi:antitoxin component of RelBE/YafQ-DinJ toxin-antitoxin module|nr:hypothetical protein [Bifidobacteriaceae bacterium]